MFYFGTSGDELQIVRDIVDKLLPEYEEESGAFDIGITALRNHVVRYRIYWRTALNLDISKECLDDIKSKHDDLFEVLVYRDAVFRDWVLRGKHSFLEGPKSRDYYLNIARKAEEEASAS